MREAVSAQVDLHRLDKDGVSKWQHLQKAKASGDEVPELDNIPGPPEGLVYLWNWFWELVPYDGDIKFTEMEAWGRLTDTQLKLWEIYLIKQMDAERIKTLGRRS